MHEMNNINSSIFLTLTDTSFDSYCRFMNVPVSLEKCSNTNANTTFNKC